MNSRSEAMLRSALHRPAISTDGSFTAVITAEGKIQVLKVDCQNLRITETNVIQLPKTAESILSRLSIFRCSPHPYAQGTSHESAHQHEQQSPLLLLSDGTGVIVLDTNQRDGHDNSGGVIADYQIGDQFGNLCYANFILGNDHALLLFEMNTHASIISLNLPQRDDVPNTKFNDGRGLAVSPKSNAFALLLRSKGQDQVAVFSFNDDTLDNTLTFAPHTSDAQGILWCPDEDPLLVVWDASTYGTEVVFFTAFGHALKQLDLSTLPAIGQDVQGIGVTDLKWIKTPGGSLIVIADGQKRVFARYHQRQTMNTEQFATIVHPGTIDGSKCIVWQETAEVGRPFHLLKTAFDAVLDTSKATEADLIEFNADRTFIATRVADNAKAVWLWQREHPDPHTVITFSDAVRQILWHPKLPHVLAILTYQKVPRIYVWHSETKPPVIGEIQMSNATSTKWEGSWLSKDIGGRHPFMLSSTKAFDIGFLEAKEGVLLFDSLLHNPEFFGLDGNEDITEEIFTPSKVRKVEGAREIMLDRHAFKHSLDDTTKW